MSKKRSKADRFPKRLFVTINNPDDPSECYLNAQESMEEAMDTYDSDYKDIPLLAEYKLVGQPFKVKRIYKVIRKK